ncbi:MAG: alanyl-tRNA editing protein AlaX-L [Clostridiales bacterium]|jgi:alanyl-tRNA synthetase|nr:alanyl-tRNA editing protein AlaX-L [Clostridiales bacterium]
MFYESPLLDKFTANIINVAERNDLCYVTLDRTAFYYGGGGQPCDLGFIDGIEVKDVILISGEIVHVLESKPFHFDNVECVVDIGRRRDYMQQHLAQHIISGCFYNLYDKNTYSIRLGSQVSTVDINGYVSKEEVLEVERLANKVVQDGLEVQSFVPEPLEARHLDLRRALPPVDKDIRILKIGDFDINACCGIHFNSTSHVMFIKIKKFENYKGNTRIEFLAGKRATDYVLLRDYYFDEICRRFNTNGDNAINAINNLEGRVTTYVEDNKSLNQKYINQIFGGILKNVESFQDINIYKYTFEEKPAILKNISERIIRGNNNNICLFANTEGDKVIFLFASSSNLKVDMEIVLRQVMQKINGKGGGGQYLAQGSAESVDIEFSLDYATEVIKLYI